jgi:hypothetical protein
MPIRVYEVKPKNNGNILIQLADEVECLIDYLKELEPGDGYTITAQEMTEEEYNALDEFNGF